MTGTRWPAATLALAVLIATMTGCAGGKKRPDRPAAAPPVAGHKSDSRGQTSETSRPQSSRYRHDRDGEPTLPVPDIAALPEPVPRAEPRSRYGNKSPYTVLGRTYTVLPSARGYKERGISSWYGQKFHGYMTSSFEPYDMYQFTAAHKSLPLPSYARVTNLENGKSVIVRVNDRGPFHENRVIDLSYAAAVRIGIWPKGTGLVEVQAIDPEHPKDLPAPSRAQPDVTGRMFLQVGAYAERANAERVLRQIEQAGIGPVRIERIVAADGRAVHRVRIGPVADVGEADALTPRIRSLGLGSPRVAIDDR